MRCRALYLVLNWCVYAGRTHLNIFIHSKSKHGRHDKHIIFKWFLASQLSKKPGKTHIAHQLTDNIMEEKTHTWAHRDEPKQSLQNANIFITAWNWWIGIAVAFYLNIIFFSFSLHRFFRWHRRFAQLKLNILIAHPPILLHFVSARRAVCVYIFNL